MICSGGSYSGSHIGTWTQLEGSRVQGSPIKTVQDITWSKDTDIQKHSVLKFCGIIFHYTKLPQPETSYYRNQLVIQYITQFEYTGSVFKDIVFIVIFL